MEGACVGPSVQSVKPEGKPQRHITMSIDEGAVQRLFNYIFNNNVDATLAPSVEPMCNTFLGGSHW